MARMEGHILSVIRPDNIETLTLPKLMCKYNSHQNANVKKKMNKEF